MIKQIEEIWSVTTEQEKNIYRMNYLVKRFFRVGDLVEAKPLIGKVIEILDFGPLRILVDDKDRGLVDFLISPDDIEKNLTLEERGKNGQI